MISEEDDVDIHALKRQGMTISEIARRTNHDRKTIRAYLSGERQPGIRERPVEDDFARFVDYITARLREDPHLWSVTLLDELAPLGFTRSYQTLTRQIRDRGLRPACIACAHVTERPNAVIEHPPGEETQFDWVELPDAPVSWEFPTKRAFLLVGSLPHSGCWRAVLSPSMELPHLLAAMTTVVAGLGGVTRDWRFDRMTTVVKAGSNDLTPMFAAFGKHYGVRVVACRPRSGNRKGVVEKTTTPSRSAGGGLSPTTSPSSRRKPISTGSPFGKMPGRGPPRPGPARRPPCATVNIWALCPRDRSRWSCQRSAARPGRRSLIGEGTVIPSHRNSPQPS